MEDITIYRHDGTALVTVPVTDDCGREWQLMGENHVRLVWNADTRVPLPAKSYIEYKGVRFTLLETYHPEKRAANHYVYDVKYQSTERLFVRSVFFRHVTVGDKVWREPEFTLNANLKTIADIITDSLNRAGFGVTFILPEVNAYADTGLKALSFSGVSLYDALTYIAEQWETEWWIEDGYILHFDRCEHGDIIELGYDYVENIDGIWESAGLQSVSQNQDYVNVPQRVYAYGSERNMIRQTTEAGDMNVSYAKRLQLDETEYPGGYVEVDNVTSGIEEVKMFDDIYPRRVGTLSSVRSEERGDMTVWYVSDYEIPALFDPKEQAIPGMTMMMKFESGYLHGFEFEVNWHPERDEWEIINRQEDDVQIPFGSLVPRTGDTYSLFNMVMPDEYISIAQKELATAAREYVGGLAATVPETTCESEPLYWQQNGVSVGVGSRVRVTSGTLTSVKSMESRVTSVSYRLTDPYSVRFNLASGRVTGKLAQIDNAISCQTAQIDGVRQTARAVSRNSWQSSQEMSRMLDSLMKELVLVGSEEGQFVLSSGITWENARSTLTVTKGKLVHTVYDNGAQHGEWTVPQAEFDLGQPQYSDDTPYYVYIRCSIDTDTATVRISQSKTDVESDGGHYNFLAGILSGKYLGSRVYNSVSGLTQIAGGTITTQILQDPSRNLIIDFSSVPPRIIARNGAVIQGKVQFTSGVDAEESINGIFDMATGAQQSADAAYGAASDAQSSANAAQQTADDALSAAQDAQDYIDNTLPVEMQGINARLDGVVENWFEPYTPARTNNPAKAWIADNEEAKHEGDTFTSTQEYADDATTPDAGKSWRWVRGTDGTYGWTPIADSDAVKALRQAAKAQDTADQKRRIFVVEPSTPYEVGDLWTQGTGGRTMRCIKARATGKYVAADWDYADNSQEYTDKAVNGISLGGRNLIAKRYLTDWNRLADDVTIQGSDSYGDYLAVNHAKYYWNVSGGSTERKDIFNGKIKYREGAQYAFRARWYTTSEETDRGMVLLFMFTDGTSQEVDCRFHGKPGETAYVTPAGKTISGIAGFYGNGSDRYTRIYDIQLTEGNKQVAGWLVAPEDVIAKADGIQTGKNIIPRVSAVSSNKYFTVELQDFTLFGEKVWKAVKRQHGSPNILNHKVSLSGGVQYTASYYIRHTVNRTENGSDKAHIGFYKDGKFLIDNKLYNYLPEWTQVSVTYTPENDIDDVYVYAYPPIVKDMECLVSCFKVETGNKATAGYTPSNGTVRAEIDEARSIADGKNSVWRSQPVPPYRAGDLWVTGHGTLLVSSVTRPSGAFSASDWKPDIKYDNTQTAIDGGIVTSGTLQAGGNNGRIRAGITGKADTRDPDSTDAEHNDSAVRFWSGAAFEQRELAPFRVLDNGDCHAAQFFGFGSFFRLTADNVDRYTINGSIRLDLTGCRVAVMFNPFRARAGLYLSLPNGNRYIGSEVEILNPLRKQFDFCNGIPDIERCNINNYLHPMLLTPDTESYLSKDYYWKGVKGFCPILSDSVRFYSYLKFRMVMIPLGSPGFTTTATGNFSTNPSYYKTYTESGISYKAVWILVEKQE